jgi:hypothetical protein
MTMHPVRSAKLERLLLDILSDALIQGTGWEVRPRDDSLEYLEIGVVDAETQERTTIANVRLIAWDMTGGLIDDDE